MSFLFTFSGRLVEGVPKVIDQDRCSGMECDVV